MLWATLIADGSQARDDKVVANEILGTLLFADKGRLVSPIGSHVGESRCSLGPHTIGGDHPNG
jgi:hypothetical protein